MRPSTRIAIWTCSHLARRCGDVTMWPERRIFFFALSFALFALASKTQQVQRQVQRWHGWKQSHLDRGQCAAFALSLRRLLILLLHFACGKEKKTRSTQLVTNIWWAADWTVAFVFCQGVCHTFLDPSWTAFSSFSGNVGVFLGAFLGAFWAWPLPLPLPLTGSGAFSLPFPLASPLPLDFPLGATATTSFSFLALPFPLPFTTGSSQTHFQHISTHFNTSNTLGRRDQTCRNNSEYMFCTCSLCIFFHSWSRSEPNWNWT